MTKTVFRPSTADDFPALAAFLRRIFGVSPDDRGPFLRQDHVAWKYWAPHPAWEGSRSFVIERDSRIVAHGAVWPLTIKTPSASIAACQVYDWAADPAAIGAGLTLLRQLATRCNVIVSIGGTAMTARMRAPMGFRPMNTVYSCFRLVRPVREAVSLPWSWKTPLRAVRYAARALPLPAVDDPYVIVEVSADDMAGAAVPFPRAIGDDLVFEQTPARLRFLQQCPSAVFRIYVVRGVHGSVGYFVLRDLGPVARIIEAWIDPNAGISWSGLFALIVRQVHRDFGSARVTGFVPSETMRAGASRVGFAVNYEQPVFAYDPQFQLSPDANLLLQFAQTDYSFFTD